MTHEQLTEAFISVRLSVTELTEQLKTVFHFFEEYRQLSEEVRALSGSMREMVTELKYMRSQAQMHDRQIEGLKERPGKRWEGLIGQIITLTVGTAFGVLFTRLGL